MATKTKKEQVKIIVNGEAKIIDLDNLTLFKTLFEEELIAKLIDMFVPVGSWMELYTDEIDPADIIPNTDWLPETNGTVLRAAGNNSIVGGDTHQLTVDEMPSHNHAYKFNSSTDVSFVTLNSAGAGLINAGETRFHSGTITIQNTGGSASHSILQKSQNCYRYRRVARAA